MYLCRIIFKKCLCKPIHFLFVCLSVCFLSVILFVLSLFFQGEHRHVIACGNCHHKSITLEPFTILSLSLPASGKCTLADLLKNCYKECCIDYNCPKCNRGGKCLRRIFIQRLPPILILHLNRFEYNISARKKAELCRFPTETVKFGRTCAERC